MKRFSALLVIVLIFLGACSQPPTVDTPEVKGIFSDSDIDNATLSLAGNVEVIAATIEDESPATEGEPLPNVNPGSSNALTAQAAFPNTSGYIYYIQYYASGADPWYIRREDQGSNKYDDPLYIGKREIQSLAGSGDGKSVVVSMRESASASSDFEIYLLITRAFGVGFAVLQLTYDSVDNTDVSMSSDSSVITWQAPVNGVPAIFFRVETGASTFTQKQLSSPLPSRQPSISSNGKFITYIHDRPDGYDQIWRYDIQNNINKAIHSRDLKLSDPSITDDGNKIMFTISDTRAYIFDATTLQYQLAIYTTKTIVHPFITADGKYVTYGYSPQVPSANTTDITVYAKALSTGQLAVIEYPGGTTKQFGMTWMYNAPTKAPNIPISFSSQKIVPATTSSFGASIDISGNTAVVGASSETYDANKDGRVDCDVSSGGPECGLGAVYILERNAQGVWNIGARIENPKVEPAPIYRANIGGQFGLSVAISGDNVVVGSYASSYDANKNGKIECDQFESSECDLGRAHIFSRNQGGANKWGLVKTLEASERTPSARFGASVDIEGGTIVIGLYGALDPYGCTRNSYDACGIGSVYIFSQNLGGTNQWGLAKQLKAPTQQTSDQFGRQLDLSGETLLIANAASTKATQILQPSFYIYARNQGGTGAWGLVKELTMDYVPAQFYTISPTVALDGATAVIGRPPYSTANDVTTYIFSRDQGGINGWGLIKKVILTRPGIEGKIIQGNINNESVTIFGDTLLIPSSDAYDANQNGVIDCVKGVGIECNLGNVYVLSRNQGGTNNWGISKILGAKDALTTKPGLFGTATAFDGTTLMVGAPFPADATTERAVYIFKP
jgi:FG-GAP repeat/WD40-like Beta Propeller Repeat